MFNRHSRLLSLLILSSLLSVFVLQVSAQGNETRTITDADGHEITFDKPVERIILLGGEPPLGVVKALQAEDTVVGVTEYITDLTTNYPIFSQLPSVGSGDDLDYERIFELKPELVITTSYSSEDVREKLEPEITVVRLEIGAPTTFIDDVRTLGIILGHEEQAEEYLNWYQGYLEIITERVSELPEDEKPRVFGFYGGDWGMSDGPPYGTYGQENIWVNPSIEMAGGINITADLPGDWITVDPEWVITENPAIIVREVYVMVSGPVMGYDTDDISDAAAMRDGIMSQPEFDFSDAAQTDDVYLILGNLLQEHWFIGVPYLAKMFHPELFADLDPQAIHQEYLTRFMRLDYDLAEHGVFVYPQP